ncbi:MAG: hypothetical protein LC687_06650, partial [Actinobacteria bacterium]|nr:hypothetical protein [Actinomycetota bacterium]
SEKWRPTNVMKPRENKMSGMGHCIHPKYVAELAEYFGEQGFGLAPTMDDISKLWAEDRERIAELELKCDELDWLLAVASKHSSDPESIKDEEAALARRDALVAAEALDDLADEVINTIATVDEVDAKTVYMHMRNEANRLRREAEGCNNG